MKNEDQVTAENFNQARYPPYRVIPSGPFTTHGSAMKPATATVASTVDAVTSGN